MTALDNQTLPLQILFDLLSYLQTAWIRSFVMLLPYLCLLYFRIDINSLWSLYNLLLWNLYYWGILDEEIVDVIVIDDVAWWLRL